MTTRRRTPAGRGPRQRAGVPRPAPRAENGTCPNRRTLRPAVPDRWPPAAPEYVIVVDQLRDRRPGQPPSLAELLEAGPPEPANPSPT